MAKDINAAVLVEAQKSYNAPIYLIELELPGGTEYYTDNNETVAFPTSGGHNYTPLAFRFDRIKTSLAGEYDECTFDLDINHPNMLAAARNSAFQGRKITLLQVFGGFLGSSIYAVERFSGTMKRPRMNDETVTIAAESAMFKFNRRCPRRMFQNNCQWTFNSDECLGGGAITSTGISFDGATDFIADANGGFGGFTDGMSLIVSGSTYNDGTYNNITVISPSLIHTQTHAVSATESAGSSITITPDLKKSEDGTADAGSDDETLVDSTLAESANWWRTGVVTMNSGNNSGLKRQVKSSTPGSVDFVFPFPDAIDIGDSYTISRGCNKTSRDCGNKFENWANFGGYITLARRDR